MVDTVDIAQEHTDYLHGKRIEEIRGRAGVIEAKATGYCLHCGEDLPSERRFCDADCRDDWEKLKRR
jgi:hypothetical protein